MTPLYKHKETPLTTTTTGESNFPATHLDCGREWSSQGWGTI